MINIHTFVYRLLFSYLIKRDNIESNGHTKKRLRSNVNKKSFFLVKVTLSPYKGFYLFRVKQLLEINYQDFSRMNIRQCCIARSVCYGMEPY